jgi:hypothetical protein
MSFLFPTKLPASAPLQNATRQAADASLQRKLITPELHHRMTDGYISGEDLAQATAALKKSVLAEWDKGIEAMNCEHNAWSPVSNDEDRISDAGACKPLRDAQDAAAGDSQALRQLLGAAEAQVAGQDGRSPGSKSALDAIANSVRRWSGIGG